ncbi:MAG: hypothetical protein AAF433_20750 [Bacteroidota bacterium]
MKEIRELAKLVNRNKVKHIKLLNLQETPQSKINRLYVAVSEGSVKTDEEAKALLGGAALSASSYANIKAELRNRLMNTLLFIDVDKRNYTDRQAAYLSLQKEVAAGKLLLVKGGLTPAVRQLEKSLTTALRFEFTEIVVELSRILRLQYATRFSVKGKYEKYRDLYQKQLELENWENEAEAAYASLMHEYRTMRRLDEELAELAKVKYQRLATVKPVIDSYKFLLYSSLVNFFQFTCKNDYESVIPLAQQSIEIFIAKPYQAATAIQLCLHHQLVGYLQLGDYEGGLEVGLMSKRLLEKGKLNWFKNLEYLLILAMHTERYQDAYQHYREAIGNSRFKSLPREEIEIWDIYRAYLHFLVQREDIQPDKKDKHFTTFRINRFLNDKPHFFKDKRGMNVAILIAQILFYLQRGDQDAVVDRMDAIEKYAHRNLYREDSLRSYYMVRLLLTLPKAGFKRSEVLKKAKRSLNKLAETSGLRSNPVHKMEIIPYEKIWGFALEVLKE